MPLGVKIIVCAIVAAIEIRCVLGLWWTNALYKIAVNEKGPSYWFINYDPSEMLRLRSWNKWTPAQWHKYLVEKENS